jgi:hypothetical protein
MSPETAESYKRIRASNVVDHQPRWSLGASDTGGNPPETCEPLRRLSATETPVGDVFQNIPRKMAAWDAERQFT